MEKESTNSRSGSQSSVFVIRRQGGGFFSIIASILARLGQAEDLGVKAYVDLESLPNPYQEMHPIHGSHNVWEYYFHPVSEVRKDDLTRYRLIFPEAGFPKNFSDSLYQETRYRDLWSRYVVPNPQTNQYIDAQLDELNIGSTTLGVHFRGQEQRRASRHPLTPTIRQMKAAVEYLLESQDFDNIVLVSEGQQYVGSLKERFGSRIRATKTFRLAWRNAYRLKSPPRSNHRYLLGLETLTDAFALSRCGGFLGCNSNLSEAAAMLGINTHKVSAILDNGVNSANPVLKKILWYGKSITPKRLGGFGHWRDSLKVWSGSQYFSGGSDLKFETQDSGPIRLKSAVMDENEHSD